jgi:hypothetical protein
MNDRLALEGSYRISVWKAGELLSVCRGKNLVVQAGKNLATQVLLQNAGPAPVTEQFVQALSLGDGADPADDSQTTLQGGELISPRLALSKARIDNELIFTLLFANPGASITVREIGLFTTTAVGTGTMFSRFVPPQFQLPNGGIMNFDYLLRIG